MFRNFRGGRSVGELTDLRGSRERDLERSLSSDHRRLRDALAEAGRTPLSMRDIERAGIANPATLIYELEIAGEAIEHVYEPGAAGHKRLVGFRLQPSAGRAGPAEARRRPPLLPSLRSRDSG